MPSPAVYGSPRTSATAATVLLSVCGATTLASLGVGVSLYAEAGALATGTESDGSALMDTALLYDNVGLLQLVAMAASAVAFVTWFHRVRVNAEVFDPNGHRFKRGWAIGGWITPVVNLWFPRQIAGDIWQAGARPDASGVRPQLPQTLLTLWWAAFWISNATARIGSQYLDSASAQFADGYQQAVAWLLASDLLSVVAAVLAVLVVRRLTAMQEERFAAAAAPAYGVHGGTVRG
ncbi:DUF4328 domain-containing protein [Kitasatospora sp. NPDC058444]|uniref:DUF4328 domain-containing protein n=1 Tax=Kitasatospora sp. NPDC058444 TaxID=3346504 RepID=UPI00365B5BA7